jgi:NAD-dependent SIR2 family protein deacetylase
MNLYPWKEVIKAVENIIKTNGRELPLSELVGPDAIVQVFQQWNCTHCGVKQTMPEANHFSMSGRCEECGKLTNIKKRGMNYMVVWMPPGGPRDSDLTLYLRPDR